MGKRKGMPYATRSRVGGHRSRQTLKSKGRPRCGGSLFMKRWKGKYIVLMKVTEDKVPSLAHTQRGVDRRQVAFS